MEIDDVYGNAFCILGGGENCDLEESEDDAENYYEKRTCLWLKGLPQLERSSCLPPPPPMYILQGEKGKGKKIGWCEGMRNIKGGQAERAKARSKTFPGIAKAMAEQWG